MNVRRLREVAQLELKLAQTQRTVEVGVASEGRVLNLKLVYFSRFHTK